MSSLSIICSYPQEKHLSNLYETVKYCPPIEKFMYLILDIIDDCNKLRTQAMINLISPTNIFCFALMLTWRLSAFFLCVQQRTISGPHANDSIFNCWNFGVEFPKYGLQSLKLKGVLIQKQINSRAQIESNI